MIEIALSLAVIGFALVAIIGILPSGMQVQKENRQETIINQDASIFLEAIRNGAQGADDLTNYVYAITNYWTDYTSAGAPISGHDGYTYTVSERNNVPVPPPYSSFRGTAIIGLLSTPRFTDLRPGRAASFRSNYVVAFVRSMSGPASDKFPQDNPEVQSLAFTYRLIPEIVPYSYYDPSWTNYTDPSVTLSDRLSRSNYMIVATNLQQNLHDVRLTFRWPMAPNGTVGQQRQIFRTVTGGHLMLTNDAGYPVGGSNLYFFQPRTYVKAQ